MKKSADSKFRSSNQVRQCLLFETGRRVPVMYIMCFCVFCVLAKNTSCIYMYIHLKHKTQKLDVNFLSLFYIRIITLLTVTKL